MKSTKDKSLNASNLRSLRSKRQCVKQITESHEQEPIARGKLAARCETIEKAIGQSFSLQV